MVRSIISALFIVMLLPYFVQADAEGDPRISRALALQKAMSDAKKCLADNQSAQAVALLEADILHVNGDESYLALMKSAYIENLKELQSNSGTSDRIDHVRRQLRILDPKLQIDEAIATVAVEPAATRAAIVPQAPRPLVNEDDPFQQAPADRQIGADLKAKAKSAFEQRQYTAASSLFKQAQQAKLSFTAEERQAWGYCRLSEVVALLNSKEKGQNLERLRQEAEEAAELGGPALAKFSQQVYAEIKRRQPGAAEASTVPEGWQTVETNNFRVLFQTAKKPAEDVSKAAEVLRTATFEKWFGPAGSNWSPRCDIWLHAGAAEYAKATNQSPASFGHSSIGSRNGQVKARRIDVRTDDPSLLEVTLPRETAYVVLSDLFSEQPLPRWSHIGMMILAQPSGEVSRYLRTVPRIVQEKKIFNVHDLLLMAEFPEADKITAFYVESVSLVDYLVRLKGAKAFALYLREAPRRGYEEALARHYGIKDAAELQERWMKFAMKGE